MKTVMTLDLDIGIETLLACYLDPEPRLDMMRATGSIDPECRVTARDEDRVELTLKRSVPVDAPPMLLAVSGETVTLDQGEVWSGLAGGGAVVAEVTSNPIGLPASAGARMTIELLDAEHCRCTVAFEAKCPVLLVGGKIEKMMLRDSEALLTKELRWVEGQG